MDKKNNNVINMLHHPLYLKKRFEDEKNQKNQWVIEYILDKKQKKYNKIAQVIDIIELIKTNKRLKK